MSAVSNREKPPVDWELVLKRNPVERLKKVNEMLTREINLLTMQQEISSAAQGEMNKSQCEYFLR